MLKFISLLICAVFSYTTFAMDKNINCDFVINFEPSTDSRYSYTGYGTMTCSDDNRPLTIFSAVRTQNKNDNTTNKFSLNTSIENLKSISYVFQTYKAIYLNEQLVLSFDGDSTLPSFSLKIKLTDDSNKDNSSLMELLNESEVIIEQDQFWQDSPEFT